MEPFLYSALIGGVGTASLESKLLHKLMAIIEEIIYKKILGLNRMYDALD